MGPYICCAYDMASTPPPTHISYPLVVIRWQPRPVLTCPNHSSGAQTLGTTRPSQIIARTNPVSPRSNAEMKTKGISNQDRWEGSTDRGTAVREAKRTKTKAGDHPSALPRPSPRSYIQNQQPTAWNNCDGKREGRAHAIGWRSVGMSVVYKLCVT